MTTESRCTGNPDPEALPAHTCLRGPLCGAWPGDNDYDPAPFYGCDHGSCLTMANEDCQGCQYEAWQAMEEGDWHGMRDAYEQEAATYDREHGLGAYAPCDADCPPGTCALVCRKQGRR